MGIDHKVTMKIKRSGEKAYALAAVMHSLNKTPEHIYRETNVTIEELIANKNKKL
ncbi:hypothetical protein [Bacillus cihuensis]|uniref:hypothetical protein n=1 Tax=Bacillus cihuensis TaxID=1208599 RepID=UPI00041BF631|nr:hypothetical protein [Bacillus cihuensis]